MSRASAWLGHAAKVRMACRALVTFNLLNRAKRAELSTVKRRYDDSTGYLQRATRPNEVWSYDFLESRTERGGRLRILTILNEYTRECLIIYVARSVSSQQVISILEWLFFVRGAPSYLRSDNGPEFVAFALQQWLRDHYCHTLYIKPGSLWENPFIESFNGTFRAKCLNRWLFADGQEAQTIIEQWCQEYNHHRPHSSLDYLPPAAFAEKFRLSLHLD
jgi:putative transposase